MHWLLANPLRVVKRAIGRQFHREAEKTWNELTTCRISRDILPKYHRVPDDPEQEYDEIGAKARLSLECVTVYTEIEESEAADKIANKGSSGNEDMMHTWNSSKSDV